MKTLPWREAFRETLPLGAIALAVTLVRLAVMLLAMRGGWGTHYDYVDAPQVRQLPFWTAFTALALVPQLVFWVAFTVVAGMVTGTLTAALMARRQA